MVITRALNYISNRSNVSNADSSLKNSKEKSQHLSEQYAENEEEIIRSKKFGAKSLKTDAKRSRLVSKTRSSSMMFRDYKNLQESASKGGKGFRNSPLENTEQNLFELFNSQIGEDLEIKIKKKVKTSDANEKAIDCNSENRTQLSESEKLFPENPLPPTLRDILESKSLPTGKNLEMVRLTLITFMSYSPESVDSQLSNPSFQAPWIQLFKTFRK